MRRTKSYMNEVFVHCSVRTHVLSRPLTLFPIYWTFQVCHTFRPTEIFRIVSVFGLTVLKVIKHSQTGHFGLNNLGSWEVFWIYQRYSLDSANSQKLCGPFQVRPLLISFHKFWAGPILAVKVPCSILAYIGL